MTKRIRKLVVLLLSLLLIVLASSICYGADYYVDPAQGNDNNAGSLSKPWKSIYKSSRILAPGDTLYLRAGKYINDVFVAVRSGTQEMPITIKAYPGEEPKIVSEGSHGAVIFMLNAKWYVVDGIAFEDCAASAGTIVIISSSNIVIRNSSFVRSKGTPVKLRTSSYITVEGSTFIEHGDPGGQGGGDHIAVQGSSNNIIRSNYFSKAGHYAILLMNFQDTYSKYNQIISNRIEQYWGGGINIVLGSEYNLIEGNVISHVGDMVLTYPKTGIQLTASNNTVRKNIIHTTARGNTAIYFGAYEYQSIVQHCQNNLVYNNTLYNIGGSGFYFAQKGKAVNANNRIVNNLIYKAAQEGPYKGSGLPKLHYYLWFDTYHSVSNWDAFPNGNIFQNNWLQSNGSVAYVKKAGAQAGQWGNPMSWVQTNYHSNFMNNYISDAAPKFKNEKNNDFTLKMGTPLINKGVVVDDVNGRMGGWANLKYCGKAPDIGAREVCKKTQ